MERQIVVSNETRTHSMQHSFVVLSRSVLLRRLGPSFFSRSWGHFFADLRSLLSMKKMCAKSGISSREGESYVRGSARAQFAKRAQLRDCHLDLSRWWDAMIDAPPA